MYICSCTVYTDCIETAVEGLQSLYSTINAGHLPAFRKVPCGVPPMRATHIVIACIGWLVTYLTRSSECIIQQSVLWETLKPYVIKRLRCRNPRRLASHILAYMKQIWWVKWQNIGHNANLQSHIKSFYWFFTAVDTLYDVTIVMMLQWCPAEVSDSSITINDMVYMTKAAENTVQRQVNQTILNTLSIPSDP